jgi:prevent-host-death family protein
MAQLTFEVHLESFAIRDLREHTGELVRNAENGQFSVVSKHGKPLFVALPFDDRMLACGVSIALADRLVQSGELSVGSAAKLAAMPYAQYLQHLGSIGVNLFETDALDAELDLINGLPTR